MRDPHPKVAQRRCPAKPRPFAGAPTFLRDGGSPIVKAYDVAPGSRFNVAVNAMVPELLGQRFGALVESTNGAPILVERAIYWTALGVQWAAGTNVVATPLP